MGKINCLVVVACLCLADLSENLVIRHRSNTASLKQAARALDRQKRHIARNYEDEFGEYYSPYELYNARYGPDLELSSPEVDYYPLLENEPYNDFEEAPYSSKNHKRSKSVPSREELEAIFGSLNRASERTKKRQISESEHQEDSRPKKKDQLDQDQSSAVGKITNSQLKEMLAQAEKTSPGHSSKVPAPKKKTSKTEVSSDDLNSIFEESDKMDKREAESPKLESKNLDKQKESNAESKSNTETPQKDQMSNKDRIWSLYGNMNQVTGVKKKRSGDPEIESQKVMSQALLDLTRRVANLEDDNARLRLIQALEDKENDLLASALKEATLAQLQGTDQYLKGEYGDIEDAIRVEEVLQDLKSNKEEQNSPNVEDANIDMDQAGELSPSGVSENKRDSTIQEDSQPYDDTMGRWYDVPVNVRGTDDIDADEKVLEDYVENYMKDTKAADDDIGQCPEITQIVSNCALAVEAGLDIDEEARDLCIRHELCYSCGGTLAMPQGRCDGGYRGEVVGMCDGSKTCIRSGANFLLLMKQSHVYNSRYNNICDSQCIKDFIVGV
ncbi:hypothetical protein FSP39_025011 [Pinctada imbricata]|uniref:Uncharacterized protein n=1 Tax=Pinctada imbricata TaxID=66713 RepID=A0AA89BZG1_PINIB|nr:hypothetical protein FSP39_025011 [Pinctada imbricata]